MSHGSRRRYLAEQEAFMAEKLDYVVKSQPLKTHMGEKDAKRVVGRYGLAGTLPKELTREQRMGAYEARYVAAGGRKGEKWQRRAERSDKVKTVGLGVATVGGGAWLAARSKRGGSLVARKVSPKTKYHADTVAVGGATAGGAAELDAARARRKRASYASAPGGAAASALRRMRAMDEARSR